MKFDLKRKIIQFIAFGFSNSQIQNFASGKIYKGSWKNFCNPGLNCYSCPAATLSCPIGAMQMIGKSPGNLLSFYVVGFVLAAGILFGRGICGFICPFGLVQELIYKIPFPIKHIRIKKVFRYIKYILLVIFVLLIPVAYTNSAGVGTAAFCKFICPAGTLEAGLPLLLSNAALRDIIGTLFSFKVLILCATIILCIIAERFFCKVLCPLGTIYALLNKISVFHMRYEAEACISCGKCASVCPMDVDPVKIQNSTECIRCGKCVHECPNKCILLKFKSKKMLFNNNGLSETD